MMERAQFVERNNCISCGGADLTELSTARFDEGAVKRFIDEDPWGEHPAPFLVDKVWSYVRCRHCEMSFHRYILDSVWNERRFSKWMSQEAIQAFEKNYKTPENLMRKAANHTKHVLQIEKLTRNIRGKNPVRILDFGCGYGEFLAMCALYGFEAFGLDRSHAKLSNNSFNNVYAEIEDVATQAPFHALTLFEVLEHLDDPYPLLLKLRDLIMPGGVLVLETPNCHGVSHIETRQEYLLIHPLEHINGFTPKTMKAFAERLGFKQIRKPICLVTCGSVKTAKALTKSALGFALKPSTQMYFRKL